MTDKTTSKSLTKGFAWTAVDRFSNLAIQFILGIVIARLITPEEYGVLGILMVFINISQVFIDSGLSSALIYKNKLTNDYLSTSFLFNLAVSSILFLALFIAAPFIEQFFSLPHLSSYIRVSSLVLFTNSLIIVPTSILRIQLDFRSLAFSNISSTLISGFTGIVTAYSGWGVWALIFQLLSKSVCQLILLYFMCRWMPHLSFKKNIFLELYHYGINIFGASCLTKVLDEGTSFFIGKVLTPFNLGIYTRGNQFSSLPANTIGGIISTALFPSLSSIKDDKERFSQTYRQSIRIQSFLCIPTFIWLAVLAEPLVKLLITEKWIAVVPVIQILCLGRVLIPAAYITEQVLNAKGRSDLFLKQQIFKMTLKTSLILCCLPFGILAVVLGDAFYTLCQFFITNYFAHGISDFKIFSQLKVMAPYLLSSLASGWIILIGQRHLTGSIMQVLLGTCIFLILYALFVTFVFQEKDVVKIASTIRNRSYI